MFLACIAPLALAVHANSSFEGTSLFQGRNLTELHLTIPTHGIKNGWFKVAYPPSSPTQRGMKSEILLLPFNAEGKTVETDTSDVLTRIEVPLKAGQVVQPGVIFRIMAKKPEHSLRYGFRIVIRAVAEHYATNGYVEDYPATDAGQFLGESLVYDLSNLGRFLQPVLNSGYSVDQPELDLFLISKLAPIKYTTGFNSIFPASKVVRLSSGDCASHAMLLVSMYRALGIPARMAVGYFSKNGRGLIPHAWVEVVRNGHWTPIEATNLDVARNPGRSIGRPESAFIMHFDMGLTAQYKDPSGQNITSSILSLQTPDVMGRTFSGEPIPSPKLPTIKQTRL